MRDIGVGIIGTEFMGRAHALAYRAVPSIFPLPLRPFPEVGGDPRHAGVTRIEAEPQHSPYGLFRPAPGYQLGLNNLSPTSSPRSLAAPSRALTSARREIQKMIDTAFARRNAAGSVPLTPANPPAVSIART